MLKNILIVDDSLVNRTFLKKILVDEYNVIEAENGKDALSVLYQYDDISLILLDIQMPIMNGYEFLQEVQKSSELSLIPIIVQTASDKTEDEIKCLAMGASDFILKPYKPEIVRHRIASIIRLRESSAMINLLEYDSLTGLYSKEFFYRQVKRLIADNPNTEFDIICSDIENFKMINDRYGMSKGNEVLKFIADSFRKAQSDYSISGYLGTDKFAFFTKHIDEYSEEVFEQVTGETLSNSPIPNLRIKFGIYRGVNKTIPVSAMCDRAFIAIEQIKKQFVTMVAEYNEELRLKIIKSQRLLEDMDKSIENREFKVYFQPKHDTETQRIVGAEGLVRWIHSELGFISPGEFIPLFEKNGFITKLDFYIWEEVLRIMRDWKLSGKKLVPVSVNVSRADFIIRDLPQIMDALCQKYDISKDYLHLEVTESAYTENGDQIIETVKELRKLGFKIDMDDFGTGYSSLNMLNKLPVDIIKLDIGFIRNECIESDKSILKFVIELANSLQLETIAEGVETESQYSILKKLGCKQIQGYYFSKPLPLEEFEKYCEEKA